MKAPNKPITGKIAVVRTGLIISIEEARKILGETAKNMTDEQLEHTIWTLHSIARESLADAAKKFSTRTEKPTSK